MSDRLSKLLQSFDSHISIPWPKAVSADERTIFVVYNKEEFNDQLKELFTDADDRTKKGKITKKFISQNIGATKIVLDYIKSRIN